MAGKLSIDELIAKNRKLVVENYPDGWGLIALATVLHKKRCQRWHTDDCCFDGLTGQDPAKVSAHRELWLYHAERLAWSCDGIENVMDVIAFYNGKGQFENWKELAFTDSEQAAYKASKSAGPLFKAKP